MHSAFRLQLSTMVSCKMVVHSRKPLVNQEICRYCRTQVCEKCYTTSIRFSEHVHHQHACVSCIRLNPKAKELRSPSREYQQNRYLRLNSVPISRGPRIDSLSNMARDCNEQISTSNPSTGFLSAKNQSNQQSRAKVARIPSQTLEVVELPTADQRWRRHTSAIASTSRSTDFAKPSLKPFRVRANTTEPQAARRHTSRREVSKSYSCDFTRKSPRVVIRDAMSTASKQMEHSMMDLRDVPTSQSCDFTGAKPIVSDEQNELRLLAVDLRLVKYKANIPAPTKQGRRASVADPANNALAKVSFKHYAATNAKLASAQRESKRYDAPLEGTNKQSNQPRVSKSVSSAGSNSKSQKNSAQQIDFHLSAVGLRPRSHRHMTTEALDQPTKISRHENQKPVAGKVDIYKHDRFAHLRQKMKSEPIDFHLSRFNLTSRQMAEAKSASNNVKVGHHESRSKEKNGKALRATLEPTTPKYSKNELCDLAYLEKFRSYTL